MKRRYLEKGVMTAIVAVLAYMLWRIFLHG